MSQVNKHMLDVVRTYPYLMWSLAAVALLGIGAALSPDGHRRRTLLNGALALPFALTACIGAPLYWSPQRVGVLPVGPEDAIYAFAAAGSAWLLASWPLNGRMAVNIRPGHLALRYVLVCAASAPCALGALLLEIKPMSSILLPMMLIGVGLLWLRPELFMLSAAGFAGFAAFHFMFLVTAFAVTPSFAQCWNAPNLWGPKLFGIPLDEIAWAAVFGAVWPLFAAFVLDARLLSLSSHGQKSEIAGSRSRSSSWEPRDCGDLS